MDNADTVVVIYLDNQSNGDLEKFERKGESELDMVINSKPISIPNIAATGNILAMAVEADKDMEVDGMVEITKGIDMTRVLIEYKGEEIIEQATEVGMIRSGEKKWKRRARLQKRGTSNDGAASGISLKRKNVEVEESVGAVK